VNCHECVLTCHTFHGKVLAVERGQASVEWLGAVALVALVLAAAVGVGGGEAVASSVVRGMHRALCVVRGGVCDLDRRPCVVEADATEDDAHVNLLVVRVGRTELILREHRSDGSVLVTYLHDTSSGWDVGVGGDVWVSAAGHDVVAGSAARLALLTSLGGGETWSFDDALDADVAMAQLSEGHAPTLGVRVARISSTGLGLSAEAQAKSGRVSGMLDLEARRVSGTLVDERTGNMTHVVRREGGGDAVILHRGDRAATGGGEVKEHLSVTTAADGTPLELSVVRTGALRAAADLPEVAQPVADALLGPGGARDRRWVVEQRLDLTEPANLQAAQEVLASLDGPLPIMARADEALRARLAEAGVTEARTYDVDRDSGGATAHGSVGVKIGGGLTDESEGARLIDARVLGPDGAWRINRACETG
jgi:hypothetical protein